MKTNEFFQHIRQLIADGQLPTALEKMRLFAEKTPLLNAVLQQSGRLAAIRQQNNLGVVSHAEATLEENRIRYGVLELLGDLEREGAPPQALGELLTLVEGSVEHSEAETLSHRLTDPGTNALQAEIAAAISIVHSKNVLANSPVTAGGNVHIGDIVYQNGPPAAPAAPARVYNRTLTRRLVEAMQPHHENAARLCRDTGWTAQPDNLRKVQQFVCKNFVGEVGKQLRSLVNIGTDEQMDAAKKQQHYVRKCLDIAKRSLDLLNFALLSQWWETVKIAPRPLDTAQRAALSDFFGQDLDASVAGQLALLRGLLDLFQAQGIAPLMPEVAGLHEKIAEKSPFAGVCARLEQATDAEDAETLLGDFMQPFGFLSLYRMASVKRITFRQLRNSKPQYQHRYVALGLDVRYSEDTEKDRWAEAGEQVPAVLLFRGEDYQNGLSLFPFVIDYNALTFEQGAKICFFNARDLDNPDALEYRFLGDNSLLRILKTQPAAPAEDRIMEQAELSALNLNCVVDIFREAQADILGHEENLFDEL
jgi:hypothetical protein